MTVKDRASAGVTANAAMHLETSVAASLVESVNAKIAGVHKTLGRDVGRGIWLASKM